MKKNLFILFITIAFVTICAVGANAGGRQRHIASSPDPYRLYEVTPQQPGYSNRVGRVLAFQGVNPAIRNLIYFVAGQSNMTNVCPSVYVPPNVSQIDNLSIYDGAIYTMGGPMLGASYLGPPGTFGPGAIPPRVANNFIAQGKADRVIIVPLALAGTTVDLWGNYGNTLSNRMEVAIKRLAALGITCSSTGVKCAVSWGQGESNGGTGADYLTYLNGFINQSVTVGMTGKFFINVQTWSGGSIDVNIQAAQIAVRNGVNVFAGAIADSLNNTYRDADQTHFNDTGCDAMGALMYTAMAPYYW